MTLTGLQKEQLSEAVLSAFTTQHLRRMLTYRLDKNLSHYVSGGPFPDQVFELIEAAEREGWTPQLIVTARQFNPGNRQLQLVADELGVSAIPTLAMPGAPPSRMEYRSFEREVTRNSFLDVVQWRTRQAQIEARVCQVMFRTSKRTFTKPDGCADGGLCGCGIAGIGVGGRCGTARAGEPGRRAAATLGLLAGDSAVIQIGRLPARRRAAGHARPWPGGQTAAATRPAGAGRAAGSCGRCSG